ncbi:hypothetical protein CRE_24825 [Caenorhabditis remanei]|uniref:Uncharacterized protein n=1 Tax=Caenorhabditis remanei TaxID=31234 RepID=E3NHM9_CAERE|nr:hypothetical protein CRE_24825 [Caenorhabditis remanei]
MSSEESPTIGDIAASRHQMGLWSCMSYVIVKKDEFPSKI